MEGVQETKRCTGCGQSRNVQYFTVVKKKEAGNSALNNKCHYPFTNPAEDLQNQSCYSEATEAVKQRLTGPRPGAAAAAAADGPKPTMTKPSLMNKASRMMEEAFTLCVKDAKRSYSVGQTSGICYQLMIFNSKDGNTTRVFKTNNNGLNDYKEQFLTLAKQSMSTVDEQQEFLEKRMAELHRETGQLVDEMARLRRSHSGPSSEHGGPTLQPQTGMLSPLPVANSSLPSSSSSSVPTKTAAVAAAAAAAPMQMPFPPAVFAATPLPQPMLLQHRVDGCGGEGGSAGAGVSTQLPPSGHYLPQKRPAPGEEQQSSYSGLATGPSGPPQIGLAAVPFGVQMLTPHQHAMMQQLQLQQSQQQQQQQQPPPPGRQGQWELSVAGGSAELQPVNAMTTQGTAPKKQNSTYSMTYRESVV